MSRKQDDCSSGSTLRDEGEGITVASYNFKFFDGDFLAKMTKPKGIHKRACYWPQPHPLIFPLPLPTIVFRATFTYLSRYPTSRLFGRLSDWNQYYMYCIHPMLSPSPPAGYNCLRYFSLTNQHQGRCPKSRLFGHLPNWPCATSIAEPFHDTDPATTRPSALNPSASISRTFTDDDWINAFCRGRMCGRLDGSAKVQDLQIGFLTSLSSLLLTSSCFAIFWELFHWNSSRLY